MMRISKSAWLVTAGMALFLVQNGSGQELLPSLKAKVEEKVKQLQKWSTDPTIVAAVGAHNLNPPAEDKAMTNVRWANLTVLDPYVRGFSNNPLGQYLKSKKDDQIAECFVSGLDGSKVAFLSKPTSWSHARRDKHQVPMSGQTYIGPMAMDDSTGVQLVQVGLPVLDGDKPIGSIVVGLAVSKLR